MPRTPRYAAAGLALVALVALGVAGALLLRPRPANPASAGFVESAQAAGLDFHMAYLPAEQGEHFKVNLYDHGCGVAVADFDGDGFDDIYFVNQLGPNALYRNNGDGTFENVTARAGVGLGDRVCVAAVFADYDNDGDQDLFVTSTRGGNVLFRNNGDGTFTDITEPAGVKSIGHAQTAVFFDYDNDGKLDLFVTYTANWTDSALDKAGRYYPGPSSLWEMARSAKEYNALYRNNGDGTFTAVPDAGGLAGHGWGGDVAVFDYDHDGYLDVYVTNMFGANQLYRNQRDGTFADVTRTVLGRTSFGAIGCKPFDFNNDGRLDLFVADMHSDMWLEPKDDPAKEPPGALTKKYASAVGAVLERQVSGKILNQRIVDLFQIDTEAVVFGNTLFKQRPDGTFEEVSDRANVETWWPWGVAAGDFDNDGYEDVFLPAGMGHPYGYWPNALLMNNGNETFADRGASLGIEPADGKYLKEKIGGKQAARSSRCAATADFRNTGQLDLVVNNFNDRAFFFRNEFPRRNYVSFRLTGTRSNRDAIGAEVRLFVGGQVLTRQVPAAGGYLSQSSKTVTFGLGDRTTIDRAEIRWPGGSTETVENPAVNTLHRRTEPAR